MNLFMVGHYIKTKITGVPCTYFRNLDNCIPTIARYFQPEVRPSHFMPNHSIYTIWKISQTHSNISLDVDPIIYNSHSTKCSSIIDMGNHQSKER